MKPIRLEIEGINSFDERQTLDFGAVGRSNLFCISGKTGAGKSTIFDCLMFAVYGKIKKRDNADIVNLSRTAAFVGLDFLSGESVYRVERNIKCRFEKDGKGNRTEKRLAETDCTLYRDGAPIAKGKDATAMLRDIVGLDMDEFKNVYLLEQGEYAEFLKKQPAKQTEAVGKIFSLMRFGDVHKLAADKAKDEDAEIKSIEARMSENGDASPETLRAAKAELSAMRAKSTAISKDIDVKKAELDALDGAKLEYTRFIEKQRAVRSHAASLEEKEKRRAECEEKLREFLATQSNADAKRIAELREELDRLIALNALDNEYANAEAAAKQKSAAAKQKSAAAERENARSDELKREVEEALNQFDGAAAEFSAAAQGLKTRSQAVNEAVCKLCDGDPSARTASVSDVIYALKTEKTEFDLFVGQKKEAESKASELKAAADMAKAKTELYSKACADARERLTAAEKADADAREKLAAATVSSHAAAICSELHTGDRCPVCGGVFDGRACAPSADLEIAKAEADRAAAELKDAEKAHGENESFLSRAREEFDRNETELCAATEKAAEAERKAAATGVEPEIYEKLAVAVKKARERGVEYAKRAAELGAHEATVAAANAESAAAAEAAAEAERNAAAIKEKLGGAVGVTKARLDAVSAEKDALEQTVRDAENKKAELTSAVETARAAAQAVKTLLDAAQADCPVDMPEFDEETYDGKKAVYESLCSKRAEYERDTALREENVKSLAEKCERMKLLDGERAVHTKRRDDLNTIAELSYGKAMLNYVATEYIEQFTAIASDILSELSGGKYTMNYDKDNGFTVADFLNDGKSRKTDTLSGGELFLASLAVAIAIARSESNGNNAFFFLDEGFGTLDDELIDVVYGALESLSSDCLVGVISHSGSLIDRMPSCVEIKEATDTSGSRIVY